MRLLLLIGLVAYATNIDEVVAYGEPNFASKFFKSVAEDEPGNIICSPLSVEMVLSMAAFGARGNTQKQMVAALTDNGTLDKENIQFLLLSLQDFTDVEWRMANKIFVAENFTVNSSYKELLENYLYSSTESVNFHNTSEASRIINDWCAAQTNNHIKELIKPELLSPESDLVLVNAVYFKGAWVIPFNVSMTEPRPFHVNGKTIKQVPTMHGSGIYGYGQLPEVKASFIELPYLSNDDFHAVSMFIILPDEIDGFEQLRKNLDKVTIQTMHQSFTFRDVNISLPKFRIESSLNLEIPLAKLGMIDMFNDVADFSGIADAGKMKVSKIVQKAVLEVNEAGSEAAAVTGVGMDNRFGWDEETEPIVDFVVDRPFVSIIATEFGVSLFSSFTADPTA